MPMTTNEPRQPTIAHDRHDHDRGERIAEAREGVGDALREAAAAGLDPMLHGARRGRQRRADAEAHQHAPEEERGRSPGGETGQDGRARPDEAGDEERLARAEFVGGQAADDLEQQIGIGEGREDEAGIGGGQAELGPDLEHLRRDALAHDVGDEIHRAEEDEHDIGGLEHALHDGLLPIFFSLPPFRRFAPPLGPATALLSLLALDPQGGEGAEAGVLSLRVLFRGALERRFCGRAEIVDGGLHAALLVGHAHDAEASSRRPRARPGS